MYMIELNWWLLVDRASQHLSGVLDRRIAQSSIIPADSKAMWKETTLTLVKGVVASVDPDVRAGDEIDIRLHVKIKVIPGGDISECGYVDGVVFRKNVSHKKMMNNSNSGQQSEAENAESNKNTASYTQQQVLRERPRILLFGKQWAR